MVSERIRDFPFTIARDTNPDGQTDDGRTFEGYAAVFNSRTHIIDGDGEYDEVIAPGAFNRTISRQRPLFMFDHGNHPLIGKMPLGTITELREDGRGLWVKARMTDSWLISPVREAVRDGALTGMSFRFEIVKDQWETSGRGPAGRLRTLKEVKVPELGPVVNPAYTATTASVRSTARALEQFAPGTLRVVYLDDGSIRDQDGLVIGTDTTDPCELVADAICALWGLDDQNLNVWEFDDQRAVFSLGDQTIADHRGLWQVTYTYQDGQVTLGPPAQVVANGYIPTGNTPPVALDGWDPNLNSRPLGGETRTPQDLGPSDEPAPPGPSDEPAASPRGPITQAERRQTLRRIQLDRLGITRKVP